MVAGRTANQVGDGRERRLAVLLVETMVALIPDILEKASKFI